MPCPCCNRELWLSAESQEFVEAATRFVSYTDELGLTQRAGHMRVKDLHVRYECCFCEAEFLWTRSSNKLSMTKEPVA